MLSPTPPPGAGAGLSDVRPLLDETLAGTRSAIAYGRIWKNAADRRDSDLASNAAWNVDAELNRLPIYQIRGAPLDPVRIVGAASPVLKPLLSELSAAIQDAVETSRHAQRVEAARHAPEVALQDYRRPPLPESWDWLERLEQAQAALTAAIDGTKFIRDDATEARDRFIYDEWCKGTATKVIMAGVNRMPGWGHIENRQGIRPAAKRYAERHDLPPPPARKPGRPRSPKTDGRNSNKPC
jgi:hypothetical protein